MSEPKRAILDVDGILWSLWDSFVSPALHKKYGVPMIEPTSWNFHQQWCTDEQFMAEVHLAHRLQITVPPFEGAAELFAILDAKGFEVVVASHRAKQTASVLQKWLNKYGLAPYSGTYCGSSKHFLMQSGDLIIDDAPHTMLHAASIAATSLTLNYEYNKEAIAQVGAHGFATLGGMVTWIKSNISSI